MLLLVGLGNPGATYANNRHNIGFMAVDAIAHSHRFSPWRGRFQGVMCEGTVGEHKILALKPATYMNLSGQSVGEAVRFYKLSPEAVIVLYDEIELEPGRVKVKRGGGSAGHNGIRSIDAHIGYDYWRVRLGVGRPGHKDAVKGHVLEDFAKGDVGWLTTLLDAVADQAPELVADLARGGDGNRFMTKVMLKTNPPPPKKEKTAPAEKAGAEKADGTDES
ncbi:MAG: aminoacyl-tRNA hydrolase [Rhodospirillaceae bacterium]|nr:MAG: aminoacyl-tRNA hydrolase [Rhodospirillaceae bacterium]